MRFKARLAMTWEAVRNSYWFVPGLMVLAAIILSFVTTAIDNVVHDDWQQEAGWLATGSADGARALLTTIAGSLIGTAGVVFSITIVTLTLAANQFGSRMLRNFMRDLGNQIVLGTFVAGFIYCLLVLRIVHGADGDEDVFIPQLGIIVAVLVALAAVGVFIYFIHHVSMSIQAPHVVASVNRELQSAIDELYPTRIGDSPVQSQLQLAHVKRQIPTDFDRSATPICADTTGHLQRIEPDQLLQIATQHDLLIRMEHRPGRFVEEGEPIMSVYPGDRVDEHVDKLLLDGFVVGRERSLGQDAEFAVVQLVEIAVRALSSGINAPSTAILCVDHLGASLGQLAERDFPSSYRLDGDNRLRVIAPRLSLCGYIGAAFDPIRQNSRGSFAVLLGMLEVFERLAHHLHDDEARACLSDHAQMVSDRALEIATPKYDRDHVSRVHVRVRRILSQTKDEGADIHE